VKPGLRFFVCASNDNGSATLPNAEFGSQIRDRNFGLGDILLPLLFNKRKGGFEYLLCVSVILAEYETSPGNIDAQTFERISSCEYALRGIAHQKKAVFTVADQGVKQSKSDLRNILNFIDNHSGIIGFRLLPL
jgi:hypothetical protein